MVFAARISSSTDRFFRVSSSCLILALTTFMGMSTDFSSGEMSKVISSVISTSSSAIRLSFISIRFISLNPLRPIALANRITVG